MQNIWDSPSWKNTPNIKAVRIEHFKFSFIHEQCMNVLLINPLYVCRALFRRGGRGLENFGKKLKFYGFFSIEFAPYRNIWKVKIIERKSTVFIYYWYEKEVYIFSCIDIQCQRKWVVAMIKYWIKIHILTFSCGLPTQNNFWINLKSISS